MILVLALAWGVLVAAPFVREARRVASRDRAAALATTDVDPRQMPAAARWRARVTERLPGAVRRIATSISSRRVTRRSDEIVARELPVTIDLLAVAVGAGCTPFVAVDVAARWAPSTLAVVLGEVRRRCTLGRGFGDALDDLARAMPTLQPLTEALLASDRFGAPVGDALVRPAAEQRTALRRRAETRARTVPVRLLFPLVFLVLPAFALLTVVPAVAEGLGGV